MNSARGIRAAFSASISGNNASDNGTTGIDTIRSSVTGNAINVNDGTGLTGGSTTGYSDNTLVGNATAASGVVSQHPNNCYPSPAPDEGSEASAPRDGADAFILSGLEIRSDPAQTAPQYQLA